MQKTLHVGSILLLAIALPALVACGKPKELGTSSTIRIQTPTQQKVGTLAALPAGRTPCYGVNVTGPGIPSQGGGCSPSLGIVGGFVEGNSNLDVSVPYGSNRRLELYMYLLPAGGTQCPGMNFSSANLSNIYYIGGVTNFDVSSPETSLSIVATFPGETNNIAVQNSYPSSCGGTVVGGNPYKFQISTSNGTAINGAVSLKGRVGRVVDAPVLTGAGAIELRVK